MATIPDNWKPVFDETSVDFVKKYAYDGYYETNVKPSVYAALLYNEDTISTTSVTLRFKLGYTYENNYYDEYHVLLDPENADNRSLHLLKSDYTQKWNDSTALAKWPYLADTTFTVTKAAKDAGFNIPAFWLMNDGYNNTTKNTAEAFYNNYKSGGGRGASLRKTVAATTVEIAKAKSVATNGGKPTVTVTDNGNNTVTISGTLGTNGANNNMTAAALYYTTDGSDPSDDNNTKRTRVGLTANSGASYSKTISITSACTVEAFVICVFTYNTTTKTGSVIAKYYAAPGNPGKPALTASSFRNGRLTIKQDWTYTWTAATEANSYSPVAGYRIALRQNNVSIDIKNSEGTVLSTNNNGWITFDQADTSITIDPVVHGFEPGMTVDLCVKPYALNGKGTKLFNASYTVSDKTTVQNAGVVNVKVNNAWVEGQVYVKVNNKWEEAETVSTKVNGKWEESE